MKITNFERLKMLPLTEEENKFHRKQKLCYTCRDKFNNNGKIIGKFEITVTTLENIGVLHILYAT